MENMQDQFEGEVQEVLEAVACDLEPRALVAAVIFSSPRPLSFERIIAATELDQEQVEQALKELQAEVNEDKFGFSLKEVKGGYQFFSSLKAAQAVRKIVPPKIKRLSRAAAETLAVIAYKQPVDRAQIESIRGVDALPTLKTLLDYKLIRIVGKQNTPGSPVLYGTTDHFLERFQLRDLADLPSVRDLGELVEATADEEGETPDSTFEAESDNLTS
ncbi:SMC-Scp complex subunit ScpB [bacterium]|nr:SMC-Scp complex subunit ScpB [bacterium]